MFYLERWGESDLKFGIMYVKEVVDEDTHISALNLYIISDFALLESMNPTNFSPILITQKKTP